MDDPKKYVEILYTNWKGVRRNRNIRPLNITFENNQYHPETQWIIEAVDLEDNVVKGFAINDIHKWTKLITVE